MPDNRSVPKQGENIRIPLPEREALASLLKVKPTADMPRPSTHKPAKKRKAKR
jgi:hypothetical protein